MIITENVRYGKKTFKRTYSNEGYYIRKVATEEEYTEAIDLVTSNYTYEETDRKIEQEGEEYEH